MDRVRVRLWLGLGLGYGRVGSGQDYSVSFRIGTI